MNVRWLIMVLFAILWIWLTYMLFVYGGGFTFKNIFVAVASAIIIFVPLWKKYVRKK